MAKILEHIQSEILADVVLSEQLAADCHLLFENDDLWLLLNKNAVIPWFILVPKGRFRDLNDLAEPQRTGLFKYADGVSDLLRSDFGSEKINVAALGNMVPQLHLHVIGRTSVDFCWPNPIWGNLDQEKTWSEQQVGDIQQRITAFVSAFAV